MGRPASVHSESGSALPPDLPTAPRAARPDLGGQRLVPNEHEWTAASDCGRLYPWRYALRPSNVRVATPTRNARRATEPVQSVETHWSVWSPPCLPPVALMLVTVSTKSEPGAKTHHGRAIGLHSRMNVGLGAPVGEGP